MPGTPAGRPPRHLAPPSRSTWQRVRTSVTVGLFAVATVVGIGVGVQGAAISPVAPTVVADATPVVAEALPTPPDGTPPDGTPRDARPRHGHHR